MTKNRLSERYLIGIAQRLSHLKVRLISDEDYIEYLCNQVYDFCIACINDANLDLGCPLLRSWYEKGLGWAE